MATILTDCRINGSYLLTLSCLWARLVKTKIPLNQNRLSSGNRGATATSVIKGSILLPLFFLSPYSENCHRLNVEAVEEFDVGFYSRTYFVKVDKLVGCVRARGASRTEFDRLPRHESLVA